MTKLEWNTPGSHIYESGVDRGVVYVDGEPGVAWNGLISVDEGQDGGGVESFYRDGVRYLNIMQSSDFSASVSAFTHPSEFERCLGVGEISMGLYASNQRPKKFDMTYRNMIGNETDTDIGYKIHLVYGGLAVMDSVSRTTLSDSATPLQRGYSITTLPIRLPGHKPTAHLVVDSRTTPVEQLSMIESMLYGSEDTSAKMPSVEDIITIFGL